MSNQSTQTEPMYRVYFRIIKLLNSLILKRYLLSSEAEILKEDCFKIYCSNIPTK